MTTFRTILAAVAGAATLANLAAADSIELRRSIRREAADRPVLLRDIAVLDGPHAEALAAVEIAAAGDLPLDRPVAIEVAAVRTRLDAAGVAWGRVDLTGGAVRIRPAITAVATAAMPTDGSHFEAAGDHAGAEGPTDDSSSPVLAATLLAAAEDGDLRAAIARTIVDDLAAAEIETDPARVQLSIRGDDLARIPADAADGVVRLRGDGAVDRVLAEISYRRPDGRRHQTLVSVEIRLLRLVPVADRRILRNQSIRGVDHDLRLERRPCLVSELALRAAPLVGRTLATTVREGERIVPSMLEPVDVVHKNTKVVVQCEAAGYMLTREMVATEDGAIGDRIACHEPGRRGRGPMITATVVGPGLLEIR